MPSDQPSAAEGFSFDHLAASFDQRAGLPAAAAERIAHAVETLAAPGLVLDIGAGTGEIGCHLAAGQHPYLGLDLSLPMLAVYRRKHGTAAGRMLVLADAATRWPIANASIGTFFLSRAAHLLRPEHLVAESWRLARPGAVLILGRVRRDPESRRALMRRQMHRLLAEQGVRGRGGERARKRLATVFERHGARASPPRQAASWSVAERPADSLAAWHEKPGLAGRTIPRGVHRDVLFRLERWAHERFGDLTATGEATERYELTAIYLAPARHHADRLPEDLSGLNRLNRKLGRLK